jgi:hypothetical protein
MNIKDIADNCDFVARKEIEEYGLPTPRHYKLSMDAGIRLANKLGANVDVVRAGVALMDIKLGECAKEGRQAEHVAVSAEFAEELLGNFQADDKTKAVLLNSVRAHHGKEPFESLEAEIVANADCYRFIHPRGVMSFHATVVRRGKDHDDALKNVKFKLEEKYSIMSLDAAKEDLEEYYNMFVKILDEGMDI